MARSDTRCREVESRKLIFQFGEQAMQPLLPLWVLYSQALATPAIAILAVVLGLVQWRTAHQRAVLDLFERRIAALSILREAVSKVVASGDASNEVFFEF